MKITIGIGFPLVVFLSCFLLISFVTIYSCTGGGQRQEDVAMDDGSNDRRLTLEQVKTGMQVTCVDCLEHIMKDKAYGPNSRYILSISGIVTDMSEDAASLTIGKVASRYLKWDGEEWVPDKSVHKKPPYEIGGTYVCQPMAEDFENAVSTGKHVIFIIESSGDEAGPGR